MANRRTILWHDNIHRSRKLAPVVLPNLLSHHERVHIIGLQPTNLGVPAVRRGRVHDLMPIHVGVSGVTHMKPLHHVTRHAAGESRMGFPSNAHALWSFYNHLYSLGTVWNCKTWILQSVHCTGISLSQQSFLQRNPHRTRYRGLLCAPPPPPRDNTPNIG